MVSLLMLAFLASCADDSPVSSLEEEINQPEAKYSSSAYWQSEKEACYYGTSYQSDSWCCSNFGYQCSNSSSSYYYGNSYYSSSSSKKYSSSSYVSESEKCRLGTSSYSDSYCCSYYGYQCPYTETEEEKEMVLTLTYYKQNKTTGEDRDPEISFKVYTFNSDGDTLQSLKTDQLTDWDNVTEWDVRIEAPPLTIAAGVATIYVCPIIIDDDGILGNQNLSSKYCYGSGNIGTLKNGDVVKQSDYENTKSILEWEWYLY